jgi:hypothetical protein
MVLQHFLSPGRHHVQWTGCTHSLSPRMWYLCRSTLRQRLLPTEGSGAAVGSRPWSTGLLPTLPTHPGVLKERNLTFKSPFKVVALEALEPHEPRTGGQEPHTARLGSLAGPFWRILPTHGLIRGSPSVQARPWAVHVGMGFTVHEWLIKGLQALCYSQPAWVSASLSAQIQFVLQCPARSHPRSRVHTWHELLLKPGMFSPALLTLIH